MCELGFHDFVWQVSQKYELRPLEKLLEGKIRTFLCAPVDLVVFNTMYGLNFNENFYRSRSYSPSMVGMSKYYRGYHDLRLDLLKSGKLKIFWFDYSKFDKRISSYVMLIVRQLRRKKINFSDFSQLQVYLSLSMAVVFSNIAFEDGSVHRKFGANPSGNTDTIVDNTLINIFLFIWFLLQYYSMEEVLDLLSLVSFHAFGDDGIYSPPDSHADVINNKNFFAFLQSRCFVAEGNLEPGCIDDAEFLSHTFYMLDGFCYPRLDTDKMISSLLLGGGNQNFNDYSYRLLRCYALRVECWPNEIVRKYCDDFAQFILDTQHHTLLTNLTIGDTIITPLQILNLNFSDSDIECLYKGLESSVSFDCYHKIMAVVDLKL
jgi:hypothetical protein